MSARIFLILLLSSLLGASAFAAESKPSAPKSLYLSIGLGRYQDSRWPKLAYTSKDARDIDQYLRQTFDRGLLLNDENHPEGVTRAAILQAIEELRIQNTREDDSIILYISTHGTMARDFSRSEGQIKKFLVTSDAKYDEVATTALAFDALLDAFGKLKSRRKALIVDSCYSGGGKAVLSPSMVEFLAKQKAGVIKEPSSDRIEGFAVYAASSWGEEAQENPELKNGVYTHFLLKGFHEDVNNDGAVQLSEAHNFASNAVMEYTRGAQHPSAKVEIVGSDPIIVKGQMQKKSAPSIFTWSWELRPLQVLFNGKKVGSMGKGFSHVPAGPGQIEFFDPKENRVIAKRQIEFRENETYSLENLLAREKVQTLTLAYKGLQSGNADLKEDLLVGPLAGPQLDYQYRGVFGGSTDLGLQVQMLAESVDEVPLRAELGPFNSVETGEQTLHGLRMGLHWGEQRRIKSPSLFPSDASIHWRRSLAYSQMRLWRSLRYAAVERAETLELRSLSSEQQLRFGYLNAAWEITAALELGAMENPFEEKVQASFFWGLSLGGGMKF